MILFVFLFMTKTWVIKIWSNVLLDNWKLDQKTIKNICNSIVFLRKNWIKVVLVSSWAVALWKFLLNIDIKNWTYKWEMNHACAAVWRPQVFASYTNELKKYWIKTSQMLLTRKDFESELNSSITSKTVTQLLDHDILPIINENDVSSNKEFRFSDNDELASLITKMILPQKLIIMTNVEWLCDKHPDDWWKLISLVHVVNESIYRLISEKISSLSKWWMKSKIDTAKTVMELWISTHIVNWKTSKILEKIFLWKSVGTEVRGKTSIEIKKSQ